jgi:hypothetical protein
MGRIDGFEVLPEVADYEDAGTRISGHPGLIIRNTNLQLEETNLMATFSDLDFALIPFCQFRSRGRK